MRLRNLTPHPINLESTEGTVSLPAEPPPVRVELEQETVGSVQVGGIDIPLRRPRVVGVTGLPEPEPDVFLVVSRLVADHVKRPDLVTPHELVRDGDGGVVGCRSLATGLATACFQTM